MSAADRYGGLAGVKRHLDVGEGPDGEWVALEEPSAGFAAAALDGGDEPRIQAHVCALANSGGGVLVIGVDAQHAPVGASFTGLGAAESIARVARTLIPPVRLGIAVLPVHGRQVVTVTVPGTTGEPCRTPSGVVYMRRSGATTPVEVIPPGGEEPRRRPVELLGQAAALLAALAALVYIAGGAIVSARLIRSHLPAEGVAAQLPREVLISLGLVWMVPAIALTLVAIVLALGMSRLLAVRGSGARLVDRVRTLWPRRRGWRWGLAVGLLVVAGLLFLGLSPLLRESLVLLIVMIFLAIPFVLLIRWLARKQTLGPRGAFVALTLLTLFVVSPPLVWAGTADRLFKQAQACLDDGTHQGGIFIGQTPTHVYIGDVDKQHIASIPTDEVRALLIAGEGDTSLAEGCPRDEAPQPPPVTVIAGPRGKEGPRGPQGPDGPRGLTGPQGWTGRDGGTGPRGPSGPGGASGARGKEGEPGAEGRRGPEGPVGPRGGIVIRPTQVRAVLASARYRLRVGQTTRVRYAATRVGAATLTVERDGRVLYRRVERAAIGANGTDVVVRRAGRYRIRLVVHAANGSRDSDEASLVVVRPPR